MYTHQILFGGETFLCTSRSAAVAFASAHRQLFGDRMRITAIR